MAKKVNTKLSKKQFEVLIGRVMDRQPTSPAIPPDPTPDILRQGPSNVEMPPVQTGPAIDVPEYMPPVPAGEPNALEASSTPLNQHLSDAQSLWFSLGPTGQRIFDMMYEDNLKETYPDAETAFLHEAAKIMSGARGSDDEVDEFIRTIAAQQPEPVVGGAGKMSDIKTELLNAFNAPAPGEGNVPV